MAIVYGLACKYYSKSYEGSFFSSWESLISTAILTILAYIAIIIILRVTGKRTLSKMNTFDFIVTIALGSTSATVALNNNIPLANGVMVFFLLIILQYLISWLSVRMKRFKRFITGAPTLLLYQGEFLTEELKKERILKEGLYVVVRSKGISDLKKIDAIILGNKWRPYGYKRPR